MDVSPKTLREVEFREKIRGYHPEDVDQFLERVAAGIEVLQDRLRQALDRAQRAEAQASESGGSDDTLRRTLVLAQRAADLAVQEAREQAARILAGAEQQAQSMIADAEDAARRVHERTLVEGRRELTGLETARERLQVEVDAVTQWVTEHRAHVAGVLRSTLASIEGTDLLSTPPEAPDRAGPVATAATPGLHAAAPGGGGPGAAPGVGVGPPAAGPPTNPPVGTDTRMGPGGPGGAGERPSGPSTGERPGPDRATGEHPTLDAADGAADGAPGGRAADLRPGTRQAAPPIDLRVGPGLGAPLDGPPTMAWPPDTNDDDGDPGPGEGGAQGHDPYFVQLRRAVADRQPLGPREGDGEDDADLIAPVTGAPESDDAFFDQDVAEDRRLGGKLRRRR